MITRNLSLIILIIFLPTFHTAYTGIFSKTEGGANAIVSHRIDASPELLNTLEQSAQNIQITHTVIVPPDSALSIDPIKIDVSPITFDWHGATHFMNKMCITSIGLLCAYRGISLFSKGVQHALLDSPESSPPVSEHFFTKNQAQGLITSCIGTALFFAGLCVVSNNETIIALLKKE